MTAPDFTKYEAKDFTHLDSSSFSAWRAALNDWEEAHPYDCRVDIDGDGDIEFCGYRDMTPEERQVEEVRRSKIEHEKRIQAEKEAAKKAEQEAAEAARVAENERLAKLQRDNWERARSNPERPELDQFETNYFPHYIIPKEVSGMPCKCKIQKMGDHKWHVTKLGQRGTVGLQEDGSWYKSSFGFPTKEAAFEALLTTDKIAMYHEGFNNEGERS